MMYAEWLYISCLFMEPHLVSYHSGDAQLLPFLIGFSLQRFKPKRYLLPSAKCVATPSTEVEHGWEVHSAPHVELGLLCFNHKLP